jgi:hypothetical protein
MKPITVSVEVPRPRSEVYDWLDVGANHEGLLDHMWTDFSFSGPPRGVGSGLRARSKMPGPEDWSEIVVVEVDPPQRIVEKGTGGGGRRHTQGTYTLAERADGGTHVTFQLEILELPRVERLLAPLIRAYLHRSMREAMRRLHAQLTTGAPVSAPAPTP